MRHHRWTTLLLGLGLAVLLAPTARADEPHPRLIEAHGKAVVDVKYVLNLRMSGRGGSRDSERSGSTTGVIVDPVGLIAVPSSDLSPQVRFGGMEISSTPTSLRVVFPGDPEEYDAVLGATDSRLGLSFIRIKDLQGREVQAVDMARFAEPQIGQRLYGVSRLSQGFDYAPYCDFADVVGHVTKPRKMWLLRGRFTRVGHPLFTADGSVAGFVVRQEGVGERGRLPFLLPLSVMQGTIRRAGREAEKVLEEALEREAEDAAAEGEEEEPDEEAGPPDDAPPEEPEEESGGEDG